jgi:hypothetical protein
MITYCVYWRKTIQYVVVLWLGCCPSVNTICGHIMIGLLLSSVSKHNIHNTTTYCVYWRWQQRQPNHNTTTYCLLTTTLPSVNTICGRIMTGLSSVSKHSMWSYYDLVVVVTKTINPIIIRPDIVFTDRRQQRQPNENTTTYCVYWRTMWSYYDWVYCCCRPSVNTICGRIMIGLSLLSKTTTQS